MVRFRIFVAASGLVLASAGMSQTTPMQPPPARPPACETAEHRQFDFWVGRWDVYPTGTTQLIAHSLIERLYAGCAIRENWMPLGGTGGGSLNSYRPSERRWRQVWTDSANGLADYSGGMEGEAMVLTGTATQPDGTRSLVRMRYSRGADGSVRQEGSGSTDGGQTWQSRYDFTYRPSRAN